MLLRFLLKQLIKLFFLHIFVFFLRILYSLYVCCNNLLKVFKYNVMLNINEIVKNCIEFQCFV